MSAFVLKDPSFNQYQKKGIAPTLPNSLNDPNREVEEVHRETFRRGRARIPVYPPISFHGDTLVNDLLPNNVRK